MLHKLFRSFSGGETSALMCRLLDTRLRDRYRDGITVFANTGQENEETLEFVDWCDRAYGWNVVWVEAVVHHGERRGCSHRVVSFETASRDGEPYWEVIKKYGIPNQGFPHCTRELKLNPMRSYLESIGWGDAWRAVGIRADEPDRLSEAAEQNRICYPLANWLPTTKPQVNTFWRDQPYRLQLAGYQGNCKWCWKKSTRKLLTVMDENPRAFDFPERAEREFPLKGPEFAKGTAPGYKRVFFRPSLSTLDLRAMHAAGGWDAAENDAVVYDGNAIALDGDGGCSEACEVNFEEQAT